MAGSYGHIINDDGFFIDTDAFYSMIEDLDDAYDACEHMYHMIQHLSGDDRGRIKEAEESAYRRMYPHLREEP